MKASPASSITLPREAVEAEQEKPWELRLRQFLAMVALTVKRYTSSYHVWSIVGLASPSIVIALIFAAVSLVLSKFAFTDPLPGKVPMGHASEAAAAVKMIFVGAYLHFGLIFSAILFGNSSLREEVDNQTLHYVFLQPAPRWIVLLGKYTGFIILAVPIFFCSLVLFQVIFTLPFGWQGFRSTMFSWAYFRFLAHHTGVLVMALMVYSALFLALSNIFKNMFYVVLIYGWEAATVFLPDLLKNFSIAYYLKYMLNGSQSERVGAIAVVSVPPGEIQTTIVLYGVLGISLAFACWLTSRKQCLYGAMNP